MSKRKFSADEMESLVNQVMHIFEKMYDEAEPNEEMIALFGTIAQNCIKNYFVAAVSFCHNKKMGSEEFGICMAHLHKSLEKVINLSLSDSFPGLQVKIEADASKISGSNANN